MCDVRAERSRMNASVTQPATQADSVRLNVERSAWCGWRCGTRGREGNSSHLVGYIQHTNSRHREDSPVAGTATVVAVGGQSGAGGDGGDVLSEVKAGKGVIDGIGATAAMR